MIRKASFTLLLVALVAVVSAAAAPNVLAQDSGVDQYLENPGAAPKEGDGGGGSGGGGSGGGGSGGGSQPAPSTPSGGSEVSGGGSAEPQGAASDAKQRTTDGSGTGGNARDASSSKQVKDKKGGSSDKDDSGYQGSGNTGLEEVEGSTASDSGSSGIGVALPIILGALLLAAIVFAVLRHRRRVQTGPA
jgi:cobalamin biosynthesis Mg chelatase CobN